MNSGKRKRNSKRNFNKPNMITHKVFEKTDMELGLIECKDADDFFRKLGIKDIKTIKNYK